jgi:hypothetical protein
MLTAILTLLVLDLLLTLFGLVELGSGMEEIRYRPGIPGTGIERDVKRRKRKGAPEETGERE